MRRTTAAISEENRELLHAVADLSMRGKRPVAMSEIATAMDQRGLLSRMIELRNAGLVVCALTEGDGWSTTPLGHSTLFGEG